MTDPAKRKRRLPRGGWIAWAVALILIAPFVVAATDWATAVRQARAYASAVAVDRSGLRFLGRDPGPARRDPGIVRLVIEEPPRTGAYTGYVHATRVEASRLWRPLLPFISGGPTRVHGSATAAVLRTRQGRWMPVLVE